MLIILRAKGFLMTEFLSPYSHLNVNYQIHSVNQVIFSRSLWRVWRVRESTVCSSCCLLLFSDYTASWNDSGCLASDRITSAWQWRNLWSHHGEQILCQLCEKPYILSTFSWFWSWRWCLCTQMVIDHRRPCCCHERGRNEHQDVGFQLRKIWSLHALQNGRELFHIEFLLSSWRFPGT